MTVVLDTNALIWTLDDQRELGRRSRQEIEQALRDSGGSVYPAKDARMSGARFRRFFPQWEELRALADPKFSSSFWRRVMA